MTRDANAGPAAEGDLLGDFVLPQWQEPAEHAMQ
jgi:hypothetical protein